MVYYYCINQLDHLKCWLELSGFASSHLASYRGTKYLSAHRQRRYKWKKALALRQTIKLRSHTMKSLKTVQTRLLLYCIGCTALKCFNDIYPISMPHVLS